MHTWIRVTYEPCFNVVSDRYMLNSYNEKCLCNYIMPKQVGQPVFFAKGKHGLVALFDSLAICESDSAYGKTVAPK